MIDGIEEGFVIGWLEKEFVIGSAVVEGFVIGRDREGFVIGSAVVE